MSNALNPCCGRLVISLLVQFSCTGARYSDNDDRFQMTVKSLALVKSRGLDLMKTGLLLRLPCIRMQQYTSKFSPCLPDCSALLQAGKQVVHACTGAQQVVTTSKDILSVREFFTYASSPGSPPAGDWRPLCGTRCIDTARLASHEMLVNHGMCFTIWSLKEIFSMLQACDLQSVCKLLGIVTCLQILQACMHVPVI